MYNTNFMSEKNQAKEYSQKYVSWSSDGKTKVLNSPKKCLKKERKKLRDGESTLHNSVMGQLRCWAQAHLSFVVSKAQG
jgi:hypothetical protein